MTTGESRKKRGFGRRLALQGLALLLCLTACGAPQPAPPIPTSPAPVPAPPTPAPPTPDPAPTPTPSLALTPSSAEVVAGQSGAQFSANLLNSSESVVWTLSPPLGSLSSANGSSVVYTPPSGVSNPVAVTLTARAAGLERSAQVVVRPAHSLNLTPSSANLTAGGSGQAFSADLQNAQDTLSWSVTPAVGTLSSTTGTSVTYTPPSSVLAPTTLTLTVRGAGLERRATLVIRPVPTPTPTAQQQMLAALNAVRTQGRNCGSTFYPAVPALAWNSKLEAAAAAHSQDMATRNFFDHVNPDGKTPGDRITLAGYAWRSYGENIAAGYGTLEATMQGWVDSPGHCANLMSAKFSEVSMAVFRKAGSLYGDYWTQDFGKPL